MQDSMHEIAMNVIVHYKASASVVFLCSFIMVLILYVEFLYILHLLRKARGCCMHVFSSYFNTLNKGLNLSLLLVKWLGWTKNEAELWTAERDDKMAPNWTKFRFYLVDG